MKNRKGVVGKTTNDDRCIQRYVCIRGKLSKKERRVDALALRADERRDKLRKAAGRSKYPLIRRYLNGETYMSNLMYPYANP